MLFDLLSIVTALTDDYSLLWHCRISSLSKWWRGPDYLGKDKIEQEEKGVRFDRIECGHALN